MRHTCRLFHILATCVVLISSATAFAQIANTTTPNSPKPTLIIWAHTNIPDQGAPTLDLTDLERYLVNRLVERQVAQVLSLQATKIPRPPAPSMYLGDLSVDVMQLAQRPVWNDQQKQNILDTVFGADISLTVKHLKTGRVLGTVRARAEHHYEPWWTAHDITEKRVAIYEAADTLAARFAAEVNRATFGDELKSLLPAPQPPAKPSVADPQLFPTIDDCLAWIRSGDHVWYIAFALLTLFISLVLVAIRIVPQSAAQYAVPNQPIEVLPSATPVRPPTQKVRKEWDERLTNAFALAIATENFSDAACQDAASRAADEIVEKREAIERDEAERILKSKERELDYARVAEYGATTSDYDAEIIVQILRDADVWPYRLLREAQFQIDWRSAS